MKLLLLTLPVSLLFSISAPTVAKTDATLQKSNFSNQVSQRTWIDDRALILTPKISQEIDRRINLLKEKTGTKIAVVTMENISGQNPKEYATAFFNHLGVGEEGKKNGSSLPKIAEKQTEPNFTIAGLLWLLLLMACPIAIVLLFLARSNSKEYFVEGITHTQTNDEAAKSYFCQECCAALTEISKTEIAEHLNVAQRYALKQGICNYSGWRCQKCGWFYLLRKKNPLFTTWCFCPNCAEPTLYVFKQTVSEGTLVTQKCKLCGIDEQGFLEKHQNNKQSLNNTLTKSAHRANSEDTFDYYSTNYSSDDGGFWNSYGDSDGNSSNSSDSRYGSSSDSSSSYEDSGSSSAYGGGDSGGGGAGGDW